MAKKISVVREELESLQAEHTEMTTDLSRMIETTRRYHEDMHVAPDTNQFRYCRHALCQLAGGLEQAWSEVLS